MAEYLGEKINARTSAIRSIVYNLTNTHYMFALDLDVNHNVGSSIAAANPDDNSHEYVFVETSITNPLPVVSMPWYMPTLDVSSIIAVTGEIWFDWWWVPGWTPYVFIR